jgi:hypothetical protein
MTPAQFNRAIALLEPPRGEGYQIQIYTKSGVCYCGAHHNPLGDLVQIDQSEGEGENPVFIEIAAIESVQRYLF